MQLQNPFPCAVTLSWASPTAHLLAPSGSFAPTLRTSHSTSAAAISVFPGRLPQIPAGSKSLPLGVKRDRGSVAALALHSHPVLPSCCYLPLGTHPAFCQQRIRCPQTRVHALNHRFPKPQLPARLLNTDVL